MFLNFFCMAIFAFNMVLSLTLNEVNLSAAMGWLCALLWCIGCTIEERSH